MCEPATIGMMLGASASSAAAVGTMAYVGAASVAAQAYSANKQAKATNAATAQATAQAKAQADAADQANNKANARTADIGAMQSSAEQAAKGGVSGTLLTGPQGVDPKALLLGKTTLLGG